MIDAETREQEKGLFYYLIVTAYFGLMTVAFFVSIAYWIVPNLHTEIRYVCDVGIIAIAVFYYLVTVVKRRIYVTLELAWLWSVPYIGMGMISLMIWIINQTGINYIKQGIMSIGCAELNVLAVACAIWLFGRKAVDYTFCGAVAAVAIVAVCVMMKFGITAFVKQYFILLITFTKETGPAMRHMEFHSLVHGFGIFTMYYAWTMKKNRHGILLFAVSLVCFTISLKRIGVFALAAGLFAGWCINKLVSKKKWYFLIVFEAGLVIFAYGYLTLIKQGNYGTLMHRLGINTMSRDAIYAYYAKFYELMPGFLGRGVRFVYEHMADTDDVIQVSKNVTIALHAAHNEYITYYIELGFWGFIFWLWSNSWVKLNGIRRRYGWEAMKFALMVIVYCFVTYVSDNTYFYYEINYIAFVTSGAAVLLSGKSGEREQRLAGGSDRPISDH